MINETSTQQDDRPLGERPWLRAYDPGVPAEIEEVERSLPETLAETARRYPSQPAIEFLGHSLTYAELDALANRFANVLQGLGVQRGDRVALLLPNTPQFVFAYYGALRLGAVVVPTSPLYVEDEIQHQLDDAEARVLVVLSSLFPRVQAVRAQLPRLEHVIVTNVKEYFPPVTRLLFTLTKEAKDGHRVKLPADGRTHWLQVLLTRASTRPPAVSVGPSDLALLQYTGGTTGVAKGAMLSHRNLAANTYQIRAWFKPLSQSGRPATILGVIPLFHIYAMTTVMNYAVFGGDRMILQPRFVLEDVLKAIAGKKPDLFPGVPTMYTAINHAPDLQRYDLRSLKGAISGAAPLPVEVQETFERLTHAKLVEGYGLTEASPVTHCNPLLGCTRSGSIGVPLPGTDATIFDQETGTRRLAPGEVGELAVRGPQVMEGYWRRPSETEQVLRDGWLFTGDLATMDPDGYFRIVDRKKDMILTGGMNVYPRDVEEPLYRHPKVKEAVALGIPDETWGEVVKAYVVLKDGESATEEEILEYCRLKMARYRVPKRIEFRESVPKSMVGKILRRKLAEEERSAARPRA